MKLFITGANRGLGLALTTEAVKRGHTVYAGARNPEQGADHLKQLAEDYPEQVFILHIDVTNETLCNEVSQKLKSEDILLDAIINNAGILNERGKAIEELDFEKVEESFQINLFGPMKVIKNLLPLLRKNSSSTIINISSEAGSFQNAYGGDYPYAISKSALNMFSEQLRRYLAGDEVSVFAVHPGWIKTDMGGENALGTPEDSAAGILDIIERKNDMQGSSTFINFRGEPMPL